MIRILGFILLIVVFFSCAESYNSLSLNKEIYYNKISTDSFDLNYKYDILNIYGNNGYDSRAKKKDVKIVAVNLVNKSNDTINFSKDIKLYQNGNGVIPKSTNETYKLLKQEPLIYYLGLLSFAFTSGSGGASAGLYLGPAGLLYVIPNVAVASGANKKFRKDLNYFDVTNLTIAPHQVGYGLLCFESKFMDALTVTSTIDSTISAGVYSKSNVLENTIDSYLYFSPKYATFANYYDSVVSIFQKDPSILEIRLEQNYYANGKLKSIGFKAKHNYSDNNEFLFKIGTWRLFYKNGQLSEYVDYNLEEQKNGTYQRYDNQGKLIANDFYSQNKLVVTNVFEKPLILGDAFIFKKNGECIKCQIVFQDDKKVIIRTNKKSLNLDSILYKDQIIKIIYD